MNGFIDEMLKERRSLEKALADLREQYQRNPKPNLARTIELIRAEIERMCEQLLANTIIENYAYELEAA